MFENSLLRPRADRLFQYFWRLFENGRSHLFDDGLFRQVRRILHHLLFDMFYLEAPPAVYVEEDRLLFSGDSVVNGIVAAIGDGDSAILESSLERILALDIEILIPGHGFTVHGQDRVKDWLVWQASYLSAVRDKGTPTETGQLVEQEWTIGSVNRPSPT